MTAGGSLATLLLDHPNDDAEPLVHTATVTRTAGQARVAAADGASALRAAGLEASQPVVARLADPIEAVTAMFATWLAGGVYVPVNPRAPDTELARIVEAIRPAAILDGDGPVAASGAAVHHADVAFVTWTSGTSGAPKAILHTHSGYLELLDRVLRPLRSGRAGDGRTTGPRPRPTPNLIPVSLALNAGIYNVLFGLRAGAEIVIMDRFDSHQFAELVHRFSIRSTVLPPAAMTMLADDPTVEDLTPLRYVRSITAPLSPLQARRFTDRFGAFVLNSYGQAEVGEVIGWTAADAHAHPEKLGAAGRPHAGVAIRVMDDGGDPVPPGGIGRLAVRPPRMAAGYASGDTLADRLDADGFLDTGDLARVDEDEFVWIEGRVGDVINRGGNKIYPDQVEEVLRLSPAVEDAAVVGVRDARLGELPVAFVVASDRVDPAALVELCRTNLVPYKVPADVVVVERLPRSEIGKVRRAELAASYQDGGQRQG